MELLEDKADAPGPKVEQPPSVQRLKIDAHHQTAAAVGSEDAGDDRDQRSLAATGGTDQHRHAGGRYVEIDAA